MVSSTGPHNSFSGEQSNRPDISYYCSADLDQVLHPDRSQEQSTSDQPSIDLKAGSILYTNPQDFFERLPPEILMEILKYLDIVSLLRASQTCRRWHYFIDNNSFLWKWFCLNCYEFPEDVYRDIEEGYSWQVIFQRCLNHHAIHRKWMNGEFSNVSNFQSLPQRSMTQLTQEEWGTILSQELLRRN